MAGKKNISGFPEWLPEEKLLENRLIETIRSVYESYGFVPIETPAVELVSTLASKGVLDKEIFAVKRLRSESEEEADLGLHFDLTVPFARYVAQHSQDLTFPFKRYQVQKVWRGDRPQKGRFREFYQFDNDIVAREDLPLSCDAECLSATCEALIKMGLPGFKVRINNRKLLQGFYNSIGLSDADSKAAIVSVDKLDKIGPHGVAEELKRAIGAERSEIVKIVEFATQRAVTELPKIENELYERGVAELKTVVSLLPNSLLDRLEIDLSLARGLDYYTGIIVEIVFPDYPEFGTVAGGGRYENLASDFTKERLPGVGFSIGLTRLFDLILDKGLLAVGGKSPSKVLVTVYNEEQRAECNASAAQFRAAGFAAEVYYKSPKLGKQIEYAEAKGIPFVAFIDSNTKRLEIKDLSLRQQEEVSSITDWVARRVG